MKSKFLCALVCVLLASFLLSGCNSSDYKTASQLYNDGKYEDALELFVKLGEYKNAAEMAERCSYELQNLENERKYQEAEELATSGDITSAIFAFEELDGFRDSKARSLALWDSIAKRPTIAAGAEHTIAVQASGKVLSAGENSGDYNGGCCEVSDWTDIISVAASKFHSIGLRSDGTVVAAGKDQSEQCSGTKDWTDIVQIDTGDCLTLGLKSDGTVVAAGKNVRGEDWINIDDWSGIIQVAAGHSFALGLKADGTVVCEGGSGGVNAASFWTNIVAIAAGSSHVVGLKADGTVVASGFDDNGQCSGTKAWTDIVQIATNWGFTVGVKSDGTVVAAGDNENGQCNVSSLKNVVAVASGHHHTVGITQDRTAVSVGGEGERYPFYTYVSSWKHLKLPH